MPAHFNGGPVRLPVESWRSTKSPVLTISLLHPAGLWGYFSYDYLGYSEPSVRAEVEGRRNFGILT